MRLRRRDSRYQEIDEYRNLLQAPNTFEEGFTKRTIAWLHQNHKYTRQTRIPEDDREDPVLRWMLSKEEGHCEYFAYSYVLLARAAGHPARIVCGFAGGKWENKTQCWVNLQTDAHAWVEVFDGTHWVRVEATPPEDGQREGEGQQNMATSVDAV